MSKKLQIPESTMHQQFAASDPNNSSWVSANAGSGKTHVLTQRVIRLMLAGNPPDKILCLTFTKAAAANMKNRVFETLAAWTMMKDQSLDEAIQASTGIRPSLKLRKQARQLFASALDTPGGLKIQTIHGFCESLLHQFPLEANVPGHFEALQETDQVILLKQARSDILSGKYDPDGLIAKVFEALIINNNDAAIEAGLAEIIAKRKAFVDWAKGDVYQALNEFYKEADLCREDNIEGLQAGCLQALKPYHHALKSICAFAEESSAVTDQKLVEALNLYFGGEEIEVRFKALEAQFLTKSQTARKTIATKKVTDMMPEASDTLFICAQLLIDALDRIKLLQTLKNSEHLFSVGLALIERYETLKRLRGVIDFDDQIEKAANLLNRSDIQEWIRYRLDRGIDHILVDEAQDTSPLQWSIINALTSDFHAGETASKINRTMFVVGDEKQSIFSFQGAEPREFELQQKRLQLEVKNADKAFHDGRLALSFRSTKDVLHAVDKVFSVSENANGLTFSNEAPVHDAVRANDPGEVQIWPIQEKKSETDVEDWLAPVDTQGNTDPVVQLAEQIADKIGEWVGKPLPGMERPLKFGDILVLVRKRDRFITVLTRTMKDKGLEVAGADRLLLTEHIAVEDLIAIGRVCLLPQDDLSLAAVLKGLLFDIDEETLFRLAHNRGTRSLYDNLKTIALNLKHPDHSLAHAIIEKLNYMIALSQSHDVFSFYALIMSKFGGRKAMLARLGMEAEDVLDSFLDEALNFARENNGGLEAFIAELIAIKPEIKREVELDRDEVRILTVHASKGLEARLVFLVDPCGPAWNAKLRPKILNPGGHGFLWVSDASTKSSLTDEALETLQEAAEAEYRRLLYVGMTRAADRLIICGYKGTRDIKHMHWHKMVEEALRPTSSEMLDEEGKVCGFRWVSEERPPISASLSEKTNEKENKIVPDWLFEPVKADAPLPRPLTPSGAHALIEDAISPTEPVKTGKADQERMALQRGNAIHKLLEMLPETQPQKHETLARQYLKHVVPNWHEEQRDEVVIQVLRLLNEAIFLREAGTHTMAEVSLSGIIETQKGQLQISGQIDRLMISDDKITILDYKSNRMVPSAAQDTPPEYVTQLALYREMVRQIYPGKIVEACLLWTQTAQIMIMPDKMLDISLNAIKNR